MAVVVDASVAAKWFFDEEGSGAARAMLTGREIFVAPDLIIAETCTIGWKKYRLGDASDAQCRVLPKRIERFVDGLIPSSSIAERAMDIALELSHPVYDCFYLAAAEGRDIPLVTADRRLLAKLAGTAWAARVTPLAQ